MIRLHREAAAIVATALDDARDLVVAGAIADVGRYLADAFKQDDPSFTCREFFQACGLDNWGEITPQPGE